MFFVYSFDHEEWEYLGVNLTVLNFTNTDPIETGFSVELRFRRRPMFYLYNLIVPVMLMAVIGFFALFLPNGSGDKINLEVRAIYYYEYQYVMYIIKNTLY